MRIDLTFTDEQMAGRKVNVFPVVAELTQKKEFPRNMCGQAYVWMRWIERNLSILSSRWTSGQKFALSKLSTGFGIRLPCTNNLWWHSFERMLQ